MLGRQIISGTKFRFDRGSKRQGRAFHGLISQILGRSGALERSIEDGGRREHQE
jgi:hypothetical protein